MGERLMQDPKEKQCLLLTNSRLLEKSLDCLRLNFNGLKTIPQVVSLWETLLSLPSHKKRYIFWKLLPYYKGFLLKFSLKSHLLFFFLTKNSKIKTLYLAYKTLHFLKIVAVLYGVFAQVLSKISPFIFSFGLKPAK